MEEVLSVKKPMEDLHATNINKGEEEAAENDVKLHLIATTELDEAQEKGLGEGLKTPGPPKVATEDIDGILQDFYSQTKAAPVQSSIMNMFPNSGEELPADPMRLVQINSARLTHANTISLMINNTAQVFAQRVSMTLIEALKQLTDEAFTVPLDVLDDSIAEMMNLFNFGSVEAIGVMKGITDGTLRVLYQLTQQNPELELNLGEALDNKLLNPWALLIKRLGTDLQRACIGFLKAEGLKKFLNVRKYNDGELVPWLDGDTKNMIRSAEDEAAYKLNMIRYQQDQQRAIDSHMAQLQFSNPEQHFGTPMKRPFNAMQGFFMPEPKKKKNYSHRYYVAKNKQRNPNPKRICKAIWQDDGITRGCKKNSHPRGVCACWKRRGFQKKDLRNGRILAWLQMAYPGKKFLM